MNVTIGLWNTKPWKTGDLATVLDMVRLADRKGIHSISMPDHVVLANKPENYPADGSPNYPYGRRTTTSSDHYFYDPPTLLAAMAAVTQRIRLGTNIIVLPIRPAIVFAKQAATLDVLSGGRLFLGVGTGWQKEEYDASNTPWDGRFGYLDEQIRACKALWTGPLVSFHGKSITFNELTARPLPVQRGQLPIYFGVGATPRQFRRIAELGDGWLPPPTIFDPADLGNHVKNLRAAFIEHGRDPATLRVGARVRPIYRREGDSIADLDTTLTQVPALAKAGATSVYLYPYQYCHDESQYEAWLDRVVTVQD